MWQVCQFVYHNLPGLIEMSDRWSVSKDDPDWSRERTHLLRRLRGITGRQLQGKTCWPAVG